MTLIELVIAIAVTGIVCVPMGIVIAEYLHGLLGARDRTVAISLARDELERLASLNDFCHADLALTAPAPPPIDGYWPGYPYALVRSVQCQSGDCSSTNCDAPANARNGLKQIQVSLVKSGSGELLASVVTFRAKYVRFGR